MPDQPKRITVYVVDLSTEKKKRKFLYFQWVNPVTKKRETESSKCTTKRAAERAAVEFEKDLNSRIPRGDGLTSFDHFIEAYDEAELKDAEIKPKTRNRILSILDLFKQDVDPSNLSVITAQVLSDYVSGMRTAGRSPTTIRTHITKLKAAFEWARVQGYITTEPQFPKQPRQRGTRAKGRPLTWREFVKILRATGGVVGKPAAKAWRRLLYGLWLSGLRVEEAVILVWEGEQHESTLWINTSGKHPLLGTTAESEKGKTDRLLPLTPDFATWLLKTPVNERSGFVFEIAKERHRNTRSPDYVSKVISAIGEASGVVVNAKGKFASAHDLRRSFGLRWAQTPGITPAELQQLMRHADIATTMKFYALVDATNFAEKLWNLGHSTQAPTPENDKKTQSEDQK